MTRKRITELFPQLIPLRQRQRKLFFYAAMLIDRNTYAKKRTKKLLPEVIFTDRATMINRNSGYDIRYQYNKVHNLKLAAEKIHGLVIAPGETFSLCLTIKNADRKEPYLDGLSLVNGQIQAEYGGGLCQLSNLLYWLFLHTPLTVTERHGHGTLSLPPAEADEPAGIDATIAEGWLDLKVKNTTAHSVQLSITFDDENIIGAVRSECEKCFDYKVFNPALRYIRKDGIITQEATVMRQRKSCFTGKITQEFLYRNSCIINYPLPADTIIEESDSTRPNSAGSIEYI